MNWLVATTKLMARGQQVASPRRAEKRTGPKHVLPSARQSTCRDSRLPEATLVGHGSSAWTQRCCCPAWLRRWSRAHLPTAALSAHSRNSFSARNSGSSGKPTLTLYQEGCFPMLFSRERKKIGRRSSQPFCGRSSLCGLTANSKTRRWLRAK